MICQFKRLIYPRSQPVEDGSYMIALYKPCESIRDSAGNMVSEVKAVGYCLPTADNLRYDFKGRWSRNAKHGIQFEVENFQEIIAPTKEGIIAFLMSGQIKGIGPKTAEKIYDTFGQKTLEVLDNEPDKLLLISGISKNKLMKIKESYLASRGARDVVAFLVPHGITPNRAVNTAFLISFPSSLGKAIATKPAALSVFGCNDFVCLFSYADEGTGAGAAATGM